MEVKYGSKFATLKGVKMDDTASTFPCLLPENDNENVNENNNKAFNRVLLMLNSC